MELYTTNTKFLKDSQTLYQNLDDLKEDKFIITSMIDNWKEIKSTKIQRKISICRMG